MVIDPATEKNGRVDSALREDVVARLITVAADGMPVPDAGPVSWGGDTVLVYSRWIAAPETAA